MKKNKLYNIIQKLVQEYTGTGAGGGNATDGSDITSPRPFPDDKSEIENYTHKNVYGAEGGHYKKEPAFKNPNRQKMGMFELKDYIKKILQELEIEEQSYPYATLTTQGQSIHRAPGVWEEDEEQLQEQLTDDEMEVFNKKKIYHQKAIAQIDIDVAEKGIDAVSSQLQQQTSQMGEQLDQIEQQLYSANETLSNKKRESINKKNEYEEKLEYFNTIPIEDEEARVQVYEELKELRNSLEKISEEVNTATEQRNSLTKQRDDILKQRGQAQGAASSNITNQKKSIRDQEKAMRNIGKTNENLLKQYIKERTNVNLMEQMDSYNEVTRGSLQKFFEMFEDGKTNEEVLQHFAKNGIQVPETYIGKAKKYFESYKKLKLELGFMEQEAKDFKKSVDPFNKEEKQLTTKLFKK